MGLGQVAERQAQQYRQHRQHRKHWQRAAVAGVDFELSDLARAKRSAEGLTPLARLVLEGRLGRAEVGGL